MRTVGVCVCVCVCLVVLAVGFVEEVEEEDKEGSCVCVGGCVGAFSRMAFFLFQLLPSAQPVGIKA
jgi:hypothetical protein